MIRTSSQISHTQTRYSWPVQTFSHERKSSSQSSSQQRTNSDVERSREWQDIVVPRLELLLRQADYPQDALQYTTDFARQQIIERGFFSHSPSHLGKRAEWHSYLTDDHTPIEYSLDIAQQNTKVRFAIEPLAIQGSASDPFNVHAPTEWLRIMQETIPDVDLHWFETLGQQCLITDTTQEQAKGLTQILCAVDFDRQAAPLVKAYVLLDATRRAYGETETMRRINVAARQLGVDAPWSALHSYIQRCRTTGCDNGAQVEFISVDCVAKEQARFKPYVRFSSLKKADFLRHVRLDQPTSSLSPHMQQYEQFCSELWDTFCSKEDVVQIEHSPRSSSSSSPHQQSGEDDSIQHMQQEIEERTHGAIFYYEMHRVTPTDNAAKAESNQKQELQPKVYLPVRHMLTNDAEIGRRIDAFLVARGLKPQGWFNNLLKEFATHRSLDEGTGMQTMIGVALKKGKPSVSVYLNPEAFSY